MWQALIGPIAGVVKEWLNNKAEVNRAKHEATVQAIKNDGNWEDIQARNSGTSWKDEWWTVVLSIPLLAVGVAVAIDDMTIVDRVHAAFATLGTLPDWYQYLLFVAICASFGIKGVNSLMEMRKEK